MQLLLEFFFKVRLRKDVNLFDKFRIEQTDVKRDKFNWEVKIFL